jgi:hypothetical protein
MADGHVTHISIQLELSTENGRKNVISNSSLPFYFPTLV